MIKKLLLLCLAVPELLLAGAESSEADRMLLESGGQALVVRSAAIGNPSAAIDGWLRPQCAEAFKKMTAASFEGLRSYELSDFFNTSLILSGAQSKDNGITAFYSPWQDAILLVKTEGDGEKRRGVEFVFLSGETFRGEKFHDSMDVVTPEKTPLSVQLWKVYSLTLQRFNEKFPVKGKADLDALKVSDPAKEYENIRLRASARTILAKKLLSDANRVNLANCLLALRVLQNGDEAKIQKFFSSPDPVGLRSALSKFPETIRKNIEPVFSLATKDSALFAYLNPGAPRFVFIVSVDKNNKFALEWFDLNDSSALYRAWEAAK